MRSGDATHACRRLLQSGISPSDLALAVTIGIVIGCLPIFGISTLLCVGVAVSLRLNLIAIQVANWFAMPLQILLFLPFLRLGQWLFHHHGIAPLPASVLPTSHALAHLGPQIAWMAAHLLTAWILVALPAALILHHALRMLFRRMANSC